MELFYIPGERRLSLRFLAYFLLGVTIQAREHDSVEDARTALALYRKYQELTSAGLLASTLRDVYDEGHRLGWKLPGDEPAAVGAQVGLARAK